MNKNIISFVLVALLSATSAYAQAWPKTDVVVAKMRAMMNLNEDQVTKVKRVIEENFAKRRALSPQLSQGLTSSQVQPLDSELYTKLSRILTPSQMSEWTRISKIMHQG
jgi:hypothetical protein